MAWNTYDSFPQLLAQADAPPTEAPAIGNNAAKSGTEGTTGVVDPNADPGLGGSQTQPTSSPFGGSMIWIFVLVLVVMWVFLMGGQRKEKKKRAALLAALTKGDKVQTIGGILGTVVEVRDSEVVVKVDENSNARLRFSRSAIQSVLHSDAESTKEK